MSEINEREYIKGLNFGWEVAQNKDAKEYLLGLLDRYKASQDAYREGIQAGIEMAIKEKMRENIESINKNRKLKP